MAEKHARANQKFTERNRNDRPNHQLGTRHHLESPRLKFAPPHAHDQAPPRPLPRRRRPRPHHLQRGQRRRRHHRLHHRRRPLRLHAPLGSHTHDHRSLRLRRNVRAYGRGHRQRPFRPDPRRIRLPLHLLRDGRGPGSGSMQHGSRICRRSSLHATLRRQ